MEAEDASHLRTLNACEACGRQYDVSHLAEGQSVRCECGQTFGVRFVRPRSPRHLRCSACGGALKLEEQTCSYCGAEVSLEERQLNSICPSCFARLLDRAHFCMECGIAIQPQALYALPDAAACPRCEGELRGRALADVTVIECASCGGMWLTQDHFEGLCETADSREQVARELRQRPAPARPDSEQPLRYIPCVACGELMHRRNYSSISGVLIDVCRQHGLWLDHSELEKILAFIRQGGLDRARSRELERLREERRRSREAAVIPPLGELELRRSRTPMGGDHLFFWLTDLVARLWT